MMRIVITGASGLIGTAVGDALRERGDEIVALSRHGDQPASTWSEPKHSPPPTEALAGADAVVHLLGEPIAQRWTDEARKEILDSRVLGTRMLVQGLRELPEAQRPGVLISQSATGYYGPHGDEQLSEDDAAGEDFLAQLTRAWEHEALAASELPGMRVVVTRTGLALSPRGGALQKMLPPFRLGVGGPVAGGRQYVPWIHIDDIAGAFVRLLEDHTISGAVNLTAPRPVTNAELSKTLGRVLNRPAIMPVPAFAVRILYGAMAATVLDGQRAIPARLLAAGYEFRYPELEPALRDVLSRR